MKKLIFLFLLLPFISIAQVANGTETKQNAFRSLSPQTVTTVNFLTTMGTDGTMGKVTPVNVTIPTVPLNYGVTAPTLGAHLAGIDTKLGTIVATTAGVTTRVWFTADPTTITAGTFYLTNATGKGTASSAIQSVTNDDNQKKYFTQDLIGNPFATATTFPPGVYAGNLSASTSPNSAQQRYTVELYRCNNAGTPIASGVSGAPVGSLGVPVIIILDSGLLTLADGSVTNVPVSGSLGGTGFSIAVGERIRYHVSAEKVGTAAANITQSVYYGTSYNSYLDVPVTFNTSGITNVSTVGGATVTNALDNLKLALPIDETTGTFSNIQTLINANPAGTTINLKPNTTYVQQGSLTVKEGITINGNGATLQRGAQVTTTLTVSANQASTSITVAAIPSNLAIGDRLSVYNDDTRATSSQPVIVTNIVGNVITLKNALLHATLPTYTWAIGSIVRKDYDQITTPYNVSDFPIATTYTIDNLILDGNKANNAGNFYWAVNSAIFNNGKSVINKCTFINMPNECIMGGGMTVKNCYVQDTNGSFIHQSIDATIGESVFGGEISGNTTKNTNLKSNTTTGHSEGVITFSFTSGRTAVIGNRFLGGGEAVLGVVASSVNAIDGANKNFIFTGNYAENFTKVVSAFNYFSSGFVTNVDNWFVNNNTFSNCGVDDWSVYASNIANMGVMKFTSNILSNGTVISNIPEKMKAGFLLTGGTVNNIPKYDANGYLTGSSITDNGTNVVHTIPIFKAVSSNGTTVSPVWDKNIFSGLLGTHESGIEFGNTLTNNNGTMLRFRVNSTSSSNTPLYPITLNSDGTTTFSSLSGTGTRTVVADASGKLSATDPATVSGTYTPTLTNTANTSALTLVSAIYTVVGNVVTVRIDATADPVTANTQTSFTATLPLTMSGATQISLGSGTAVPTTDFLPVIVQKNSTTLVNIIFKALTDVNNAPLSVTFSYLK